MNRTYLLVLLLGATMCAASQTVVPPYNPDVNQDSFIGLPDLLGFLPMYNTNFTPGEVTVDGQTLTEYIAALEEAAGNATSDTITIPMLSGTAPGQMLYWDGAEWTFVPTGQPGDALLLDGTTPTWRKLKTGCPDSLYLEYDPQATVDDGSCATLIDQNCVDVAMDGHIYSVLQIGNQCWFTENLRTTVYANGDLIPAGLTDGEWTSTTSGATAVYGEGISGCGNYSPDIDACDYAQSLAEYGRLYNWYAVDDARGLCPSGWHVPTDGEWTNLEDFITAEGFSGTEGTALKSTYGWYNGGNGTDDFGFSALPGGRRHGFDGTFVNAGYFGFWWSSSPSGSNAWDRDLDYSVPGVGLGSSSPRYGFSVRCLRDADPIQGCMDPAYLEYDATANTDDGSCATLVVNGCTDPAYLEYDATANTDDGSCATLVVNGCTDWDYVEYDATANTDDGSCATLDTAGCAPVSMDGYTYSVVEIGNQCWLAENLRTTVYANGDVIPAGLTNGEWTSTSTTTTGATAVYGEGSSSCNNSSPDIDACDEAQSLAEYGRLYNWYAVYDARGLCPTGWHVPTDGEWTDLEDFITAQGFSGTEGTALKSTNGWNNAGNGTDDFGFSALPGGVRSFANGGFSDAGTFGGWWSSSPYGGGAWSRSLYSFYAVIYRVYEDRRLGFSVRCLRDADFSPIQGCTDPDYLEYDATANTDDGSCATLVGCTDPAYVEYDAAANADDGSCVTLVVNGCTDPDYLEYDATANTDDGSCATLVVNGCTDPAYVEYDATANTDDGSCATLVVNGCTDPAYVEYDATANTDDGSCATLPCTGPTMDGYSYSTVLIGDQCWFAENLRTTVYADDSAIPEVTGNSAWTGLNTGARCDYQNDAANVTTYGRLYNWYAATDAAGLCPTGWHVPTDEEWTDLEYFITAQGFSGTAGTALKSTYGWNYGGNGTDDFGFSALPGGSRSYSSGSFSQAGDFGYWWSSSPYNDIAWFRGLYWYSPGVSRFYDNRRNGFSVRCLRDADFSSGCMDPAYLEYDATANTDDGSCATLVVNGCTDPNYLEYDATANTDDGSCATLVGCTDPAYVEYDAAANADDGSCATLVVNGCTDPNYLEYDATANTDDGSCATLDPAGCAPVSMDGYTYSVVEIGNQCWLAENLRTTTYADGTAIPAGLTDGEWTSTTSGATAVYGEGSSVCINISPDIDACDEAQSLAEYGRLYNWSAVGDARGLCPTGWHVPTDGEWTDLENYITSQGFDGTEGTALKSTYGWYNGGNGTDDFGFSALPGGSRDRYDGYFSDAGGSGFWWSSSSSGGNAWYRNLYYSSPDVSRSFDFRRFGFSVRCLRDAD